MEEIYSQALREVLDETGFTDITVQSTPGSSEGSEVVSTIGITGETRGYMVLKTDLASARTFAFQLAVQMGIQPESQGEGNGNAFTREALGEITNQIAGRAIMFLAAQGLDCNITPPTVITGSNITTSLISFDIFHSFLISGSFGKMGIFIGIKNAKI